MSIEIYHTPPPQRAVTPSVTNGDLYRQMVPAACGSAEKPHVWELRKRIKSGGAKSFQRQCVVCGYGGAQVARASVENPDQVSPYDETLDGSYQAERRAMNDAYLAKVGDRDSLIRAEFDAMWWRWYDEYLLSDVWQRRRALVMERAGGICEACRKQVAVQVHHLTYARVGREPLFDLVAVCKGCHDDLGDIK